jgi:hypothetical protein
MNALKSDSNDSEAIGGSSDDSAGNAEGDVGTPGARLFAGAKSAGMPLVGGVGASGGDCMAWSLRRDQRLSEKRAGMSSAI